jgi:hypothetical protein
LHAQQSDVSVQMIQALGGGYRPSQPAPNLPPVASGAASGSFIDRS